MRTANLKYQLFCLLMLACAIKPVIVKNQHLSQLIPLMPRQTQLENNQGQSPTTDNNWAFAYWYQGNHSLTKLPLTTVEQLFAKGFPGAIARFTDGQTVWVIRHVRETTRMLHPAVDCFRGLGYQVSMPKVVEKKDSGRWRCFLAEGAQNLQVCERIFDAENRQWSDVSAWYWENIFKSAQSEWWAVTQVSRADLMNR